MGETRPIRLTDEAPFVLGRIAVTPAARLLAGPANATMIEPRVMQVLVVLHRQCGEVVGRDTLVDACWDGLTVGEDAINRAILKLRRALDGLDSAATIETVAKVGYRLRADPAVTSAGDAPVRASDHRRRHRWLFASGAVAAAGATAAMFALRSPTVPAEPRLVVVQPLRAASGDSAARRLSQDFASDLSRTVLGHDAELTFADAQGGDGRRRVAFAVSGSVASIGPDLHAVVAVRSGDDPAILWSHDYTAPLGDAAGLRQQLETNVAAVLVCALGTEGVPEPFDAETAALYLETCNLHAGDHRRESELLRQVVARAPRFAGAWTDLSISLTFASADADRADIPGMRREADAAAKRALALDPHLGRAYFARGLLLAGIGNWAARERIVTTGLAAQPDCPQLYNMRAEDLAAIGRLQNSIASNRRAVALDPLFPGKTASLARTLADAGRADEARAVIRHMRETWPDNDYTLITRFETAAWIGDPREADAMLDTMHGRLSAGEIAAWRAFLRVRQRPTTVGAQRVVASLADERHRGDVTDRQVIEELTLLGRPALAIEHALRMPVQADGEFWFQSFLRPVRADPRFMTIAERQGLYPIWRATGLWPDFCADRSLPYDCRRAPL